MVRYHNFDINETLHIKIVENDSKKTIVFHIKENEEDTNYSILLTEDEFLKLMKEYLKFKKDISVGSKLLTLVKGE